jgi:hypothetical protein
MKALKKILVIIYCVSFIVMTVAPSSAVPCCCNTRSSSAPYAVPALEPTSPPIQSCCTAKKVQVPSCCAIPTQSEKPCNLTRTVNLDCGHCSCLKHLQLVGISENLTDQRLSKSASNLPVTADSFTLRNSENPPVAIASVISTPDQTFILHCCLRF